VLELVHRSMQSQVVVQTKFLFPAFLCACILCLHFVVAAGDDGNSLSTAAFAPFDSRSAQTMLAVVLALVRFLSAARASLAMNVV